MLGTGDFVRLRVRRLLQCIFILFFLLDLQIIEKMIITLPMIKYHESNKSVHFESSFRFSLTLYFRRIKEKQKWDIVFSIKLPVNKPLFNGY